MTTKAKIEESSESGQSASKSQISTEIFGCCEHGDLTRLKELLRIQSTVELVPSAHDMLLRACDASQFQIVQFLVDKYPDTKTTLPLHKAAFSGGVEIYGFILEKYPALKEHSFGHISDPISEAVLNGDTEMLDFLLARGFEAKNSHYCYVPVISPRYLPKSLFLNEALSNTIDFVLRYRIRF